jgi:phytoene/squalene synthetase
LAATESSLFQLGAATVGAGEGLAEPACRAGIAYGLARRLARFPADRAHARTIIPNDILAGEGLSPPDVFLPDRNADLHRAILALTNVARGHLHAARLGDVPRQAAPVFLPVLVVEALLRQLERQDPAKLNKSGSVPELATLFRMSWAKLGGGLGSVARRP